MLALLLAPQTVDRSREGGVDGLGELQLRAGPAAQHRQLLAVPGHDGGLIFRSHVGDALGHRFEHSIPVPLDAEELVQIEQEADPCRLAEGELRHVVGRRDDLAATDLVEVLDRHLLAADQQCELAGVEAGHSLPIPISDHRLEVQDSDRNLLGELSLRDCLLSAGRERKDQRKEPEPGCFVAD